MVAEPFPTLRDLWAAWDLFKDAIYCGIAAGAVLGFLGVYVVLRRMVFVSAAVTQSAGLGVALSFYVGIHGLFGLSQFHLDPALGAVIVSLLASLLFVLDPARFHLTSESLLGFVYAISGAAAILIGTRISQEAHDIQSILFGSAVLVRTLDLYLVYGVGGAVLALHLWWFRGMTFASFDPVAARVQRLPVPFLNAFLFLSIGGMVGVSARALGALPVFAMTTLPATAAIALALPSLQWTFAAGALIGALSGGLGYVLSFVRNFPVGASQTVVAGLFLVAALLFSAVRNRLSKYAARGASPILRS